MTYLEQLNNQYEGMKQEGGMLHGGFITMTGKTSNGNDMKVSVAYDCKGKRKITVGNTAVWVDATQLMSAIAFLDNMENQNV